MSNHLINSLLITVALLMTACSPTQSKEAKLVIFSTPEQHLKYMLDGMTKLVDGTNSLEDLQNEPSVYGYGTFNPPKNEVLNSLNGKPHSKDYLKTIRFNNIPFSKYRPLSSDGLPALGANFFLIRSSIDENWNTAVLNVSVLDERQKPLTVDSKLLTENLKFKAIQKISDDGPEKGKYIQTYSSIGSRYPIEVVFYADDEKPSDKFHNFTGWIIKREKK